MPLFRVVAYWSCAVSLLGDSAPTLLECVNCDSIRTRDASLFFRSLFPTNPACALFSHEPTQEGLKTQRRWHRGERKVGGAHVARLFPLDFNER